MIVNGSLPETNSSAYFLLSHLRVETRRWALIAYESADGYWLKCFAKCMLSCLDRQSFEYAEFQHLEALIFTKGKWINLYGSCHILELATFVIFL